MIIKPSLWYIVLDVIYTYDIDCMTQQVYVLTMHVLPST